MVDKNIKLLGTSGVIVFVVKSRFLSMSSRKGLFVPHKKLPTVSNKPSTKSWMQGSEIERHRSRLRQEESIPCPIPPPPVLAWLWQMRRSPESGCLSWASNDEIQVFELV